MKMKHTQLLTSVCLVLLSSLTSLTRAQAPHEQAYFPPADKTVQKKLESWQDMKFGLLMHWGPYSIWGVVESWSICPEDEDWCRRKGPMAYDYFVYKKAYEGLQHIFNPVDFNPAKWAEAAKGAGMKYMVFTTKHHDGFCMFDTYTTDYKITSSNTPFSKNSKSDITLEIFNAFRKEKMWVGAYFSKPDWSNKDYWDPTFPPFDRNPNYIIEKYPEKWDRFKKFTYTQIDELMTHFGPVDILWLDGGWVQPMTPTSPRWGTRPMNQDLQMDSLAALARRKQPGLIIVDRAVEGPNQNYLTPEQHIPGKLLPYPWETCMTMGNSWSYVPGDTYKPAEEIISKLCVIVARGGNLLLNIAPSPKGDWDPMAYYELLRIGDWLGKNGEAIYNTQPLPPYEWKDADGSEWVFTRNKNGKLFAINLYNDTADLDKIKTKLQGSGHAPKGLLPSPMPGFPMVVECISPR